jgi:small-conductance mechanosensitive channel
MAGVDHFRMRLTPEEREALQAKRDEFLTSLTPEQKTAIKEKLAEAGITKEFIESERRRLRELKAEFQRIRAEAEAHPTERRRLLKQLNDAIRDTSETQIRVFRANMEAVQAALKARAKAPPAPAPFLSPAEYTVTMKTLIDLLAAANDWRKPFAPEELKEMWDEFQTHMQSEEGEEE